MVRDISGQTGLRNDIAGFSRAEGVFFLDELFWSWGMAGEDWSDTNAARNLYFDSARKIPVGVENIPFSTSCILLIRIG